MKLVKMEPFLTLRERERERETRKLKEMSLLLGRGAVGNCPRAVLGKTWVFCELAW